ncbi:MAG: hypothetical protein ACN4GZ_02235 [Acidimicrobiales bacterium]
MLGDNLLPLLLLALGGALAAGTLMALIKPPTNPKDGNLAKPPLGRSVVQIAIGTIAAIWALVSMLT